MDLTKKQNRRTPLEVLDDFWDDLTSPRLSTVMGAMAILLIITAACALIWPVQHAPEPTVQVQCIGSDKIYTNIKDGKAFQVIPDSVDCK